MALAKVEIPHFIHGRGVTVARQSPKLSGQGSNPCGRAMQN